MVKVTQTLLLIYCALQELALKYLSLFLFFSIFLSSCANSDKKESISTDWLTIGYEDGKNGVSRKKKTAHNSNCKDQEISLDLQTYQRGYNLGLVLFCTAQNGYQRGIKGSYYSGICSGSSEELFLSGYEPGKKIHLLTSERNGIKQRIGTTERQFATIEGQIADNEIQLFSPTATQSTRTEIYNIINALEKEWEDLDIELGNLYIEKAEMDKELTYLRKSFYTHL